MAESAVGEGGRGTGLGLLGEGFIGERRGEGSGANSFEAATPLSADPCGGGLLEQPPMIPCKRLALRAGNVRGLSTHDRRI